MLKVGLTGGIGSGKTTIAKLFELLHIPVYYADAAAKRLYETDAALKDNIKKYFGEETYTGNALNKTMLASIVFNDPQKLELLNALVHPPTIKDAEAWMARQKAPYLIKEAALLFESGSVSGLDIVIGVYTPRHLRIKRVMERDGVSRDDVLNRMNRQVNEEIKMRLCDHIIINNEQELIIPQVLRLHQMLLQKSKEML